MKKASATNGKDSYNLKACWKSISVIGSCVKAKRVIVFKIEFKFCSLLARSPREGPGG